MGRMAVVGCEASGKTVFMAAMADYYRPNDAKKLCLVPENSAANRFAAFQRRQMRFLHQWPPATNPGRTVKMDWTLRADGKTLAEIGMLEFGGETFRAAFRDEEDAVSKKQAVKDLTEYLSEADFVLVLVSLKDLFRDPAGLTPEEFERDTEALWVTRGILEFVRDEIPAAGVVIGLTQADRYRAELAEGGGAAAVFAARWPTVRAAAPLVPVVEIASVSRTDENGLPAEGYRTDGILPVMREMARLAWGEPDALVRELAAEAAQLGDFDPAVPGSGGIAGPSAYTARARAFAAKLDDLVRAAAFGGDDRTKDIATFEAARERFLAVAKGLRKPPAHRRRRPRRPAVRRVFLLALVLAAVAGVAPLFLPKSATVSPEPFCHSATSSVQRVKAPAPTSSVQRVKAPAPTSSVQRVKAPAPTSSVQQVKAPAPTNAPVSVRKSVVIVTPEAAPKPRRSDRTANPSPNATAASVFSNRLERARAGDVKCKRWIAHQYYSGSDAVAQDLVKARELYGEAAGGGDARAHMYLAAMLETGEGGPKDISAAFSHYRKAAEAGIPDALYRMGTACLEQSRTDPKAVEAAGIWFRKAKAAGCTQADLDELISRTR